MEFQYRDIAGRPEAELRALLRTGAPRERVYAAWALAMAGGAQAAGELGADVGDEPSAGVRRHIIVVLAGAGQKELLATLARHDPSAAVRATACQYLARLVLPDDLAHADALLHCIHHDRALDVQMTARKSLRSDTALALIAAGELPRDWATVQRFARSRSDQTLAAIARLFADQPDDAPLSFWLQCTERLDWLPGKVQATVLASVTTHLRAQQPPRDESKRLRQLLRIHQQLQPRIDQAGTQAVLAELQRLIGRRPAVASTRTRQLLAALARARTDGRRQDMVARLGRMWTVVHGARVRRHQTPATAEGPTPAGVDAVAAQLRCDHPGVRLMAARALACAQPHHQRAADALATALTDVDVPVRLMVAATLLHLPPMDATLPALRTALADPVWTVRWRATSALARVDAHDSLVAVLETCRPANAQRYDDWVHAVMSLGEAGESLIRADHETLDIGALAGADGLLQAMMELVRLDPYFDWCESWDDFYRAVSPRHPLPRRLTLREAARFSSRHAGQLDHLLSTIRQINRDHGGEPCQVVVLD